MGFLILDNWVGTQNGIFSEYKDAKEVFDYYIEDVDRRKQDHPLLIVEIKDIHNPKKASLLPDHIWEADSFYGVNNLTDLLRVRLEVKIKSYKEFDKDTTHLEDELRDINLFITGILQAMEEDNE